MMGRGRGLGGLAMAIVGTGCVQPLGDWCLYSYSDAGLAALDSEFTCELRSLDDPIPTEVEGCGRFYLLPEANNFASNVKYDRYYDTRDLSLISVMAYIDRDDATWYGRRVACESTCSFGDEESLPLCDGAL